MKSQPYRNPKLLKLAKDAPCALCGRYGTTVSAHSNYTEHGKGMGRKADDAYIAFLCYPCHSELDQGKSMNYEQKRDKWYFAMSKTYHYLLSHGLLIVNPLPNTHEEFQ